MSTLELVDRGFALREEIAQREAELKKVETELEKRGLEANAAGRVEDLKDEDREGRRWLARGTARVLPVIFTADLIVGSFAHSSPTHKRIAEAAPDKFLEFFKPLRTFENRFKDGKKFRAAVAEQLDKAAPAFITACLARDKAGLPKSAIKLDWDHAEAVAKENA